VINRRKVGKDITFVNSTYIHVITNNICAKIICAGFLKYISKFCKITTKILEFDGQFFS